MVSHGRVARLAEGLLGAIRRDWAHWRAAVTPTPPDAARLFVYRAEPAGGSRRIHLRIEPDGSGVLLIDVTDVIHLNATAAWLAKRALDCTPVERAIAGLHSRFRGVDPAQVGREARQIYAMVDHLTTTTDDCPTCGLRELARTPPFGKPATAPLKADLALSYGCNNACGHCYNPPGRAHIPSLAEADWCRVLGKLAEIGVPHVIFTGGEPTLHKDLPRLIRHAQRLGLLTGVNTNGRRLCWRPLVESLAEAGLDHVQITLQSHRADVHDAMSGAEAHGETIHGIENAVQAGLHTITNTTLTRRNASEAQRIVELVHGLGLRTFAMNGMIYSGGGRTSPEAIAAEDLGAVLIGVRDRAEELRLRFLWYTPTEYCRLSPVELELGPRRCNAGEYSICIEPNGDVLPCQSYYTPAGNLLRDPWEKIFHGPLFRSFRDRVAQPRRCGLPERCWDCPDLPLCSGGCRLERQQRELTSNAVPRRAGLSREAASVNNPQPRSGVSQWPRA